jgi:carbonic anhydrase
MSACKNPFPWHHWPQQSPINLTRGDSLYVKTPKSYFKVDYRDAPFDGEFKGEDGHGNFELNPHSGSHAPTITVDGVRAELVKIHLHTPSEHDVEGQDLGGEVHLIHKIESPATGSEFIVLGVFFEQSKSATQTAFFKTWASEAAKFADARATKTVSLDPRTLLPKTDKWYRYEGSLTSEPYSEIISWLVFTSPLGVSSADLQKLKKHAHQPERPVQPISRRFVIRNFQ